MGVGSSSMGFGGCLIIFMLIGLLFAAPLEYVAEYWLSSIKGEPVDIPFWVCIVAGPLLAEVSIPGSLLTLILDFADIPEDNPYIPN